MKKNKKLQTDHELDFLEYSDSLNKEEKEYIKKFYQEFYQANIYNEEKPMLTKKMKSEALRNYNSAYRDAYSLSSRTQTLEYTDFSIDKYEFMEDASDEWDWQNAYLLFGYRGALMLIFSQTKKDLENKKLNVFTTLARFLSKANRLRIQHNRVKKGE